jgi:hypothetical protein
VSKRFPSSIFERVAASAPRPRSSGAADAAGIAGAIGMPFLFHWYDAAPAAVENVTSAALFRNTDPGPPFAAASKTSTIRRALRPGRS